MRRNVGNLDRALRLLLGSVLLGITFFGPQTYLGWIGLGPLFTAITGYDPFYELLDFSTFRARPPPRGATSGR